ncbi:hypothetical protein EUGRSUZ_I01871 [Eucalyptus grandis]|uniref:Uncharacterized protein n=2 Tax=Eucalyptus grandis TaxID=71139 RepID=A0ACC3JGB8_EUCGR|nr:hypothetical protein EUGRSUZ_I01871 [Eucalyptus grandis]
MKVYLAHFEWYKNKCKDDGRGPGYYGNSFKNKMFKHDHEVVKFKSELEMYWKAVVEEAEKRPQLAGAMLRICWLFTGTNYQWMVEPPSTINGVTEVTYLRGDQSTSSY